MTISPKAVQFIIAQEDGDQAYYDRTEAHFDWPGGASGPTVGVGYDLGYVKPMECSIDWTGIVDDATVKSLILAIGMTGENAHVYVQQHRADVTITWAQAVQEFTDRELPKWEARTAQALPNYDLLSPDCAGALVSLAYNRGAAGFNSTLPRFREMLGIRDAMTGKNWVAIPGLIRSMARLWPNVADLRRRRALEADLFAGGIPQCQSSTSQSTSGSDSPSSSPPGSPPA